ncbi:MAG TPA: radical SAM protein [Terriglobales bacterium]|nr:radical SAM protein [Terriglobales bacterium]
MAEILLTHSYHLPYDPKQVRKMQPYPPLGTLYAAAVLRQQGLSVALFDTMLEDPVAGFPEALRRHRPRVVAVYEDDFNFLTKMCLTRMREVAWEMAQAAHESGAVVIAHGSDASDHVSEYLEHGFDCVISGEAECKLAEVCRQLLDARGTPKPQSHVHGNSPSLNGLPLPARDLVEMERYRQAWHTAHGRFSLSLVSSRGCPFRCNWCAKPIFGDKFHVRPAAEVAQEMRLLRDHYGAEHLWFADDIFALNRHWTEEFAREVERLRAAVPFKAQARADLMAAETVAALRRAGCEEIWMGVESGSQKVLDSMDKGLDIEDVFLATARLKRAGIRPCFFLQFGYPGETLEDIEQTVAMVRRARPHDIGVSVSYPLPNTRFYQMIREQMGSKRNWRDSDDLCVMFRGAYSDEFYRALRNALHAEVSEMTQTGADAKAASRSVRELWRQVAELEPVSRIPNPTVLDRARSRDRVRHHGVGGFVALKALAVPGGANG